MFSSSSGDDGDGIYVNVIYVITLSSFIFQLDFTACVGCGCYIAVIATRFWILLICNYS